MEWSKTHIVFSSKNEQVDTFVDDYDWFISMFALPIQVYTSNFKYTYMGVYIRTHYTSHNTYTVHPRLSEH